MSGGQSRLTRFWGRAGWTRLSFFELKGVVDNVIFLDARLRPSDALPAGYSYPAQFLEYLLFEEREQRTMPGAKTLEWRWPFELHFEKAVTEDVLAAASSAGFGDVSFFLVPFARDTGDAMWFFGPDAIYSVDLGWKEWIPVKEAHSSFVGFVNDWRVGCQLPAWQPAIPVSS